MNCKDSAAKRHKQSEVRRMRNKSAKSTVHTFERKFVESVHAKDQNAAGENLKVLIKELDTVAGKGILTKKAVARKKSRMTKFFNVSFAAN
ncbi:MAG: 30S ribosomal protein S20 [Treponemataceae bacterium]